MPGLPIANNEDVQTCRACGGQCCKTLPGAYLPDQLTDAELGTGLAAGRLVLAWWDGDPRPELNCFDAGCDGSCARCTDPRRLRRAYYVRPRNRNSAPTVFDGTQHGECVLLGPTGCTLSFEARPAGCQNLLVNRDRPGDCHDYAVPTRSFKHYAAVAWAGQQDRVLPFLAGPPSTAGPTP